MSTMASSVPASADHAQPADGGQYLGFYIGGEEYAVGILGVKEILEYETVTRVPKTPTSIRGVINLRGSVVPVVDLAVKFGLPESPVTKRTCIVVLEVDQEQDRTVVGVIADAVSQVIDLAPTEIEPPPRFGTQVHLDYLRGMGRTGGKKFVLILDADKVLSSQELLAAAAAAHEASETPASADAPPDGQEQPPA